MTTKKKGVWFQDSMADMNGTRLKIGDVVWVQVYEKDLHTGVTWAMGKIIEVPNNYDWWNLRISISPDLSTRDRRANQVRKASDDETMMFLLGA